MKEIYGNVCIYMKISTSGFSMVKAACRIKMSMGSKTMTISDWKNLKKKKNQFHDSRKSVNYAKQHCPEAGY